MLKEISSLDVRATIDLAHETAFDLGGVSVRPSTRELVAADGTREVLEPRVMQVLVALARAGGAIVTRDELTACCWEGRIVGEDAINRVISRLRRSAEGIGRGAFRIETVTKVGYRLAGGGFETTTISTGRPGSNRRALLAGGAVAGLAAVGGTGVWLLSRRPPTPALPADVQAMFDQGWTSIQHASPEQNAAAVGLFRQVTERAPDYPPGWSGLGLAYMQASEMGPPEAHDALRARARSAADRALTLDPQDTVAAVVYVDQKPLYGNWLALERDYRRLMARDPKAGIVPLCLAALLLSVGRVAEAADLNARAISLTLPSPTLYFRQVVTCMAADRLEEADRMAERGMSLFPRHYGVWFTTFYLYLYTGRATRALAFAQDVPARPPGIPVRNFDQIVAVAHAVISGAKADIDRAMEVNMAAAREGAGYTENAMQFASFLGRLDNAFELAEAYFFARGFDPGMRSFSAEQGNFYRSRRTHVLFQRASANMRADPRFIPLVEEIGLKRYWEESRTKPDYLSKEI